MATIIIGGDICPTKNDSSHFTAGNVDLLFNDLLPELKCADSVIANLETPLIEKLTPIKKSGKVFGVHYSAIKAIKNANINILNLGNNHIFDHGHIGLEQTFSTLTHHQIKYLGAGNNLHEAAQPLTITIDNTIISFLSYTENEFSIATHTTGGANPISLIDFTKKISKLRLESHFVILLYHGGKEYYPYPTPQQKELCEFFIDMGVDIVVCQHSHVIGAIQNYNHGIIFYGQGNFLFDPTPHPNQYLYSGFLIKLTLQKETPIKTELLPFFHRSLFHKSLIGIQKMNDDECKNFNEMIQTYSSQLTSVNINKHWVNLCEEKAPLYLSVLQGHGKIRRKIITTLGLHKILYSKKALRTIKNYISCETHREIILTILKNRL
ncbi:MAG: CapA family protein [Bacteroidales bacterium]|nr:CapA family protein [Bacteroidales bacterium]